MSRNWIALPAALHSQASGVWSVCKSSVEPQTKQNGWSFSPCGKPVPVPGGVIAAGASTALAVVIRTAVGATWLVGRLAAVKTRAESHNGGTEVINGRLEHLRGSALGFRNLTNYIARSLLKNRFAS